jgi:glycerol-3-phosphate acyltransferase PlsY
MNFFTEIGKVENWWLVMSSSYLLGAIPFGLIITRFFLGYDVRTKGSGNIGMTNVMRTGGKIPGIATFLLDFGKGGLAIIATKYFFSSPDLLILISAFLVVFGHTKSIFLKFSGGKGVATNFGVWLVLDWRIFLVVTLSWLLTFKLTKISSLSAMISLVLLPLATFIFYGSIDVFVLTLLLSLYILILHKDNLRRLLKGEEKLLKVSS